MSFSIIEKPSSGLTITIINETTASCEWLMHAPGQFAAYIPFYKDQMEENIGDVERGMEDLFLQDVEDIKITEGDKTLIVSFNLIDDYTDGFLTGKGHAEIPVHPSSRIRGGISQNHHICGDPVDLLSFAKFSPPLSFY